MRKIIFFCVFLILVAVLIGCAAPVQVVRHSGKSEWYSISGKVFDSSGKPAKGIVGIWMPMIAWGWQCDGPGLETDSEGKYWQQIGHDDGQSKARVDFFHNGVKYSFGKHKKILYKGTYEVPPLYLWDAPGLTVTPLDNGYKISWESWKIGEFVDCQVKYFLCDEQNNVIAESNENQIIVKNVPEKFYIMAVAGDWIAIVESK